MQHSLRLMDGIGKARLKVLPFDGPVLIREGQSVLVLDSWGHLGTANSEAGVASLLQRGKPTFDQDTYLILLKHLKKMAPLAVNF